MSFLTSVASLSPYNYALQCEEKAKATTTSPKERLSLYLEGACAISPRELGLYNADENEKYNEFIKCAQLWVKAGELFKDPQIEKINLYRFKLRDFSHFTFTYSLPQAYASTCYFNAAKTLLSANFHQKLKEKNLQWNVIDEYANELFEKAILTLKGMEAYEYHPLHHVKFKERKIKILYWMANHARLLQHTQSEIESEIFQNELKIYEMYTKISDSQKTYHPDLHEKRAFHLNQAALYAPNKQKQKELAINADIIAQLAWGKSTSVDLVNPPKAGL